MREKNHPPAAKDPIENATTPSITSGEGSSPRTTAWYARM
jgi:hypothetical protein